MKQILFISFLALSCLASNAQPFLEFIQKEINLDTVPMRMIDGQPRMVLKVTFKNVGNEPLVVEGLSTVVTDYSMKREYKYLPPKPVLPQKTDSIVVIIFQDSERYPLYFYNPTVWEFSINSNSTPNYFNSMKCIWNYCQSKIISLTDLGSKHTQLMEGTNYTFHYLLLTQGEIPITIDSIIFEVKDKRNYKRIRYQGKYPFVQKKGDTLNIDATINTVGQYGEVRCESYVYHHYPNLQSAKYNTNDDYEILPNFKILDSTDRFFGVVNQGEKIVKEFSVKNDGSYPLFFRNSDCISFEKEVLSPGEIANIHVAYDSKFDSGTVEKFYRIVLGRTQKDTCYKWESNLKHYDVSIHGLVSAKQTNLNAEFLHLKDTVLNFGIIHWKEIKKRNHFPDDYIMIADSMGFVNVSEYEIKWLDVDHPQGKYAMGHSTVRHVKPGESGKIYLSTMIKKGEKTFNDVFVVKIDIGYGCQQKRFEIPVRLHGIIQY